MLQKLHDHLQFLLAAYNNRCFQVDDYLITICNNAVSVWAKDGELVLNAPFDEDGDPRPAFHTHDIVHPCRAVAKLFHTLRN